MKQAATQRTPLIEINEATCRMVGECYPEEHSGVFGSGHVTLRSVVPDAGSFTVDLELFYFNSSSAKFFFDFFEFFEEKAAAGLAVKVNWNYREDDDTMLEAGEDFGEDLESCVFELIEVQAPSVGDAE